MFPAKYRYFKYATPVECIPRGWRFDSRIAQLPNPGCFVWPRGILVGALEQEEGTRAPGLWIVLGQWSGTHSSPDRFFTVIRPQHTHCVVLKTKQRQFKLTARNNYKSNVTRLLLNGRSTRWSPPFGEFIFRKLHLTTINVQIGWLKYEFK